MTTYRAPPGDGQNEAMVFREVLEIIYKAPEWENWKQAPGAAIEFSVPNCRIKGLLGIEKGEPRWWSYVVDRERLRTDGAEAIARVFLDGYTQARNAYWSRGD
jgi:hypothetical protein